MDFSKVFHLYPDPVWLIDTGNGEVLAGNESAFDLFGYPANTSLLTVGALFKDLPGLSSVTSRGKPASATIKSVWSTAVGLHQKKHPFTVSAKVVPFTEEGKAMALIICRPGTGQTHLAGTCGIEASTSGPTVEEIAGIGVWRYHPLEDRLEWSELTYRLWDLNPSRFQPRPEAVRKTIHPEDVIRHKRVWNKAVQNPGLQTHSYRILLPDGSQRWVLEKIQTLKHQDTQRTEVIGTVQDITFLKNEQDELKLLESVITHTNDAIIITEAEPQQEPGPRILYVNEAFTRMTGYSKEEAIGRSPRFLQGTKSDRKVLHKLGASMKKWQDAEASTINYKKNGDPFWINFKISPVHNDRGYYTHWIAIERDITQQKSEEINADFHRKINSIFNTKKNIRDIIQTLCDEILQFGSLIFVELWMPDMPLKYLRLKGRSAKGKEGHLFYQGDEEFNIIEIPKGLPGKVWKTGKSQIWNPEDKRFKFLRAKPARKASIQHVIGIPLIHHNETTGVLLMGTADPTSIWQEKTETIKKIRHTLGAELYRKRLEDEYSQLLESVPDIVALLSKEGNIIKINQAARQVLEYDGNELLHFHINDIIHPDHRISFEEEINSHAARGSNFRTTVKCITKYKQPVWLSWNFRYSEYENIVFANAKDISSEKRLRSILDDASTVARIGGWEIDLINNKVYWSEMVHELHETDPASYIPDPDLLLQFYREDFRDHVYQTIAHTAQTGEAFDYEAVIITSKGKSLWIRAIGHTEKVDDQVVRIYGSFQDIEHAKQTEFRLQSLSDNLPGVIFQYAIFPDGRDALLTVNKGCEQIWGFSREDCLNHTNLIWDQIEKGGDKELLTADILRSRDTLTQWHSRYRYLTPDGKVRWLEGYGTPRKLPDGTVIWDSLILDITPEIRTKALYKETAKLAQVGSWEIILDNGKEVNHYWAPILREIHEIDENHTISISKAVQFFIPEDQERYSRHLNELIENGTTFNEIFQIHTQTGQLKWVRCIAGGDFVNGECCRLYGSYQDITEKRNAELKLIEVLNSISEGFYALDHNLKFTYFNSVAESLLRTKARKVLGKSVWSQFPDAKGTILQTKYESILKNRVKDTFEYFFPGDESWYEINVYPTTGGISVFFRNINQRKKEADEIRKAYEERNEILESIGDAFFAVDRKWTVTYWNRVAESLLEKPKEEIIGKNLWVAYSDSIHTKFFNMYHRAMETGKMVSFDEYYKPLHKWFDVTVYPSAKGLSIYFKDITIRKEWESKIRLVNERFEKVAEATNDAIWDWHFHTKAITWERGFKALFGGTDRNKINTFESWIRHIHPDEREKVQSSLHEIITSPASSQWKEEYRIERLDGSWADVMHRGMIIRDDEGHPIRMVGAITDFTYLKSYERQLIELNDKLIKNIKELELANEELEKFAFITSHDLQEPLRMISSFMELLKKRYGDQLDDKANLYIYYATDGAKRMKNIILDLLEYSRAGSQNDRLELLNITDIVNEYTILRRKIIHEKKATIICHVFEPVEGYPVPLKQVLHCLLDNGLKYTRPEVPPFIEINMDVNDDRWQISVTDNGIGIDAAFFEKIFVIFQRLHNRNEYDGTGIGLSIVRKQVTSWGGEVWLESESGKGSTFHFTIPKKQTA